LSFNLIFKSFKHYLGGSHSDPSVNLHPDFPTIHEPQHHVSHSKNTLIPGKGCIFLLNMCVAAMHRPIEGYGVQISVNQSHSSTKLLTLDHR